MKEYQLAAELNGKLVKGYTYRGPKAFEEMTEAKDRLQSVYNYMGHAGTIQVLESETIGPQELRAIRDTRLKRQLLHFVCENKRAESLLDLLREVRELYGNYPGWKDAMRLHLRDRCSAY